MIVFIGWFNLITGDGFIYTLAHLIFPCELSAPLHRIQGAIAEVPAYHLHSNAAGKDVATMLKYNTLHELLNTMLHDFPYVSGASVQH